MAPILVVVNLGRFTLGTEWLRAEDGPLEYATAVGFLIAAALLTYVAIRDHLGSRSQGRRDAMLLLAMALGMFVISFEEISWGQRLFGWRVSHEARGCWRSPC